MNVLGLVFSLLLILSYGFYACWDKQTASSRLRTTYVAHQEANRKILNSYQSQIYKQFSSKPKETTSTRNPNRTPSKKKKAELNRECAKLNLWPLIQEGREKHPILYELTAKLIRTFYGTFSEENRFEYHFLDALIASAKTAEENPFTLEKLTITNYQKPYYKMLKGTKTSYPSLLDYVKIEQSTDKICLFHAHPNLIAVLFNSKIAQKLHSEIHREEGPLLTRELIERICMEMHVISLDPDLFALLELGKPDHEERKKTFIAEDRDVSLRRNLYIKG